MIHILYLRQIEPLRESELGTTPTLTIQNFWIILIPSLSRASSLEEPLNRKLALRLEAILCPFYVSIMFNEADLILFIIREMNPLFVMVGR